MATLNGGNLPSVKMEDASSMMIKDELMDDAPSPDMEDDIYEDAGDLDFTNAQKRVWLSHIPRSLWETLSTLNGNDEIEIGILRIEGPENNPSRASLHLSKDAKSNADPRLDQPKTPRERSTIPVTSERVQSATLEQG